MQAAQQGTSARAIWRPRVRSCVALVAVVALVVTLRLPSFWEPHHYGDEGIFAATAQRMLQGDALYRGSWDNKPPVIYLVYAVVLRVAGASMPALRLVGALWAAGTCLVVYLIGRQIAGRTAGWIAAGICAVLAALPMLESTLLLTEAVMVLPIAVGMLLALRAVVIPSPTPEQPHRTQPNTYPAAGSVDARCGVARDHHIWLRPRLVRRDWTLIALGAVFAVAGLTKQVAALDAAAALLWLLLGAARRARVLVLVAIGGLLPVAVSGIWLARGGALGAALSAVLGFYDGYLQEGASLPPLLAWSRWLPLLLAVGWIALHHARGHRVQPWHLIALWLGTSLLGATLSGRPFGHYLWQMYAPASLALVLLLMPALAHLPGPRLIGAPRLYTNVPRRPLSARVHTPAERSERTMWTDHLALATVLALSLWVVANVFAPFWAGHPSVTPAYWRNWARLVTGQQSRPEHDRFFSWRVPNQDRLLMVLAAEPDAPTLFVWGEYPWLYPQANARNPTRYATSYLTAFVPAAKAEALAALIRTPPTFIVQERDEWRRLPGLDAFLAAHYSPITEVDATILWRRR